LEELKAEQAKEMSELEETYKNESEEIKLRELEALKEDHLSDIAIKQNVMDELKGDHAKERENMNSELTDLKETLRVALEGKKGELDDVQEKMNELIRQGKEALDAKDAELEALRKKQDFQNRFAAGINARIRGEMETERNG